jgi:hypothetical protein
VAVLARHAAANEVREYSLEKKARIADVVVAGHVLSIGADPPGRGGWPYARVRVDVVLKGTPRGDIEVLTDAGIAEMDPECCEVGKSYLFFLERVKSGRFESVNARFGIYALPVK